MDFKMLLQKPVNDRSPSEKAFRRFLRSTKAVSKAPQSFPHEFIVLYRTLLRRNVCYLIEAKTLQLCLSLQTM
jgi:hypothetical protein